MCILKEEQSKELDDKIKNEYFEIRDYDRWRELKVKIEEELRREGKLGNSLTKILAALNNYLRKIFLEEEENKDKDMFSFLYKIILYITFSDSTPWLNNSYCNYEIKFTFILSFIGYTLAIRQFHYFEALISCLECALSIRSCLIPAKFIILFFQFPNMFPRCSGAW